MIHKTFLYTLFAALLGLISVFALAAMADTPKNKDPQTAEETKIPQTVEDHMDLAKKYQEKAVAYNKEAQEHEAMAAAYKKSAGDAQAARGQRNPVVVKMEKHCAGIAKAALKLADENQKAADYHTLRAKELQGK
jgi:hypothetical protein